MGLLLSTTMLYLVFLTSLASAEFLSPVEDQDDVVLPEMCEEDTVISCTLVYIDLDSLNNDTLVFNDTTLTFLDKPGNDSFTFSSEDGDEDTFTLDQEMGAVWGHVELADARDFIIEPLDLDTCPGCHVLIEEDRSAFPLDHKVAPPEFAEMRSDSALAKKVGDLIKKGKTDKTTMVTYTIKIYYTPEVRKSVKNIATMVENVVAQTNQGYENSKIPVRVKLHCMEETNVPEAQMNDLGVFNRYKGGGNNLRGSADAAALLITHSDQWCGVGYMPNIPEDQMTSWPFQQLMSSITVTKCAIGSYTFGHEVSHNFGNDHDQYDKTNKIQHGLPETSEVRREQTQAGDQLLQRPRRQVQERSHRSQGPGRLRSLDHGAQVCDRRRGRRVREVLGQRLRGRRWQDDNLSPSNNLFCPTCHFDHFTTCNHDQ